MAVVPFLMAAAAAAAAARSALDGGSSMLILEPASERVNFFGHSLVLAQLNTSYMELDIRRMSVRWCGDGWCKIRATRCSAGAYERRASARGRVYL